MKINYLDGRRFYKAFLAGSKTVKREREYLNKINVFPVPDSDTGTNMVNTLNAILNGAEKSILLNETLKSMADSGITGAQGNSVIIFTQFLVGISNEIESTRKISVNKFAEITKKAIKYLYNSVANPVEGTLLSVIRDWVESFYENSRNNSDFYDVLKLAYKDAKNSLEKTTEKIEILSENGVVDAGARGFVFFIEGIIDYMKNGSLHENKVYEVEIPENLEISAGSRNEIKFRYCVEALITELRMTLDSFKKEFSSFGESFIVVGDLSKFHLHIHTNNPDIFFNQVRKIAKISGVKVDDMSKQYSISNNRKYDIGIITDSACDLPETILDRYQILQIPFYINYGEDVFLDKKTINTHQFYNMLKEKSEFPVSSQPSLKQVREVLDFASRNFKKVYAVTISKHLTGLNEKLNILSHHYSNLKVVNSRHLSVSEGLIVMRLAKAIENNIADSEIDVSLENWIDKTEIFTDINTLKYMVRGGRVSPLKGKIAKALNLKPIVSVDKYGKAVAYGKSFSRKSNMQKILKLIKKISQKRNIWNYALVHAEAPERVQEYAEKITTIVSKKPAYIMPLSPVVGVHNGIGAVGIGVMKE
mgnify:CR=1 FL=1